MMNNSTNYTASGNRILNILLMLAPLLVFLAAWEYFTWGHPERQFIFSRPSLVLATLGQKLLSGHLLWHSAVTAGEAVAGFLLGTATGAMLGLMLWYSPAVARISRPYIIAIGSIPVFALAPVMIVWFGIGIFSKIMMAALSTVVVAIVQSYQGAVSVDERYLRLMHVMGATRWQVFRKVVVPSALVWVINSMKLNVSLALLGAFIGEFISANQGLGYLIVKSSGLYDMATVLAACIMLTLIALGLTGLVGLVESRAIGWRQDYD